MQLQNNTASSTLEYARVFFALFPDKSTQKLFALQADKFESICGGRKIKPQHIHLTLVFLGDVDSGRIDNLKQIMQPIAAKSFELSFDTICYWKHNKIVSLQPSHPPAELFSLVNALEFTLSSAGFLFDKRDYKPHITLIRKATCPPQTRTIKPILFHATEWSLVQSKPINQQVDYIPLAQWSLA